MSTHRIHSLDDPRLVAYRDLPKSNPAIHRDRFVVEGHLMVQRLAASNYELESIVVDERRMSMVPAEVPAGVPVYVLESGVIEQLIGFNFHRGILACGRRKPDAPWSDFVGDRTSPSVYVIGVDIQDPTNLGGILRNCAAFGVNGVLLYGATADPFSRRVLRVSMGTAFQLRIAQCSGPVADLGEFRNQAQVELVATILAADAEPLESARRTPRMALLIGNEGHGLGREWIEACDRRVTLAMDQGTDSLNAAAASAVLLYHFTRVASVEQLSSIVPGRFGR